MRAKHDARPEKEGVLHVAGGMSLRDIDGLEIEEVGLHFGTRHHVEASLAETLDDPGSGLRDEMERAAMRKAGRKPRIHSLVLDPGIETRALESRASRFEPRLDPALPLVRG